MAMKTSSGIVALALLSTMTIAAQAPAGKDLIWAFPTAVAVVNKPPVPEVEGPQRIAGSARSYTQAQLDNLSSPPDWFPDEHAPMPRVINDGTVNKGFACSSCHLPNGLGHPE